MDKLGLLPLVRKLQLWEDPVYHSLFSKSRFSCWTLRHFWALTKVQELGIDYLDIPRFMSRIRRYFKHLFPTVRSLSLGAPKGSRRQIIYFIGLFQHLEDLRLLYSILDPQDKPADDATPAPLFTPPLRGRLTVIGLKNAGLLKEMIARFGGIRFRYMDIYDVEGMRLLLDACAKTLETLRLDPTDPRGEQHFLKFTQVLADIFAASFSHCDFDLSRNKSLRTLEVRAWYLDRLSLLTNALSAITSTVFSEVTVFYQNFDEVEEVSAYYRRFEVLQAMHSVWAFQLVLCAHVRSYGGEYSVRTLEEAVAAEKEKWGVVFFPNRWCFTDRGRPCINSIAIPCSHYKLHDDWSGVTVGEWQSRVGYLGITNPG
jgi:hypothetical protein